MDGNTTLFGRRGDRVGRAALSDPLVRFGYTKSRKPFWAFLAGLILVTCAVTARAGIYEWAYDSSGNVIQSSMFCPDGAGVSAMPNANLTNCNLELAYLINADIEQANLSNANLYSANLTNANMAGATVTGAEFAHSTLTSPQLCSTASNRS